VGLDVRGIEEDVGEADVVEAALAEGADDPVELLADATRRTGCLDAAQAAYWLGVAEIAETRAIPTG